MDEKQAFNAYFVPLIDCLKNRLVILCDYGRIKHHQIRASNCLEFLLASFVAMFLPRLDIKLCRGIFPPG